MKIAMVSTPYVPVPPKGYGGTELIVGLLTEELVKLGHHVELYATGDSQTTAELKSLYKTAVWPPKNIFLNPAVEIDHVTWAIAEAEKSGVDLIHMHCQLGVSMARMTRIPIVYTIHHPFEEEFSNYYHHLDQVSYVAISDFQKKKFANLKNIRTIHHGLRMRDFTFINKKRNYLVFLGRIAEVKGVHLAIEVARRTDMPLKIAGDIQPIHQQYFNEKIAPLLDGKQVEYLGEADFIMKVELLKNAKGMLFPILWDEPFGLVMIESIACGTPVIAFPGGSVPEIIKNGISGYVVNDVDEMVKRVADLDRISPRTARDYADRFFSVEKMVSEYLAVYQDAIMSRQPRRYLRMTGTQG